MIQHAGRLRETLSQRDRNDDGSGLIGTITGITTFLAFMFFAVQLLTNLYATSVVTDVATDGAHQAARYIGNNAGEEGDGVALDSIEASMAALLGKYGDDISFDWTGTSLFQVQLRVQAENPNLLFNSLGGRLPFTDIDRTVTVRIEQVQ